MKQGYTAKNPPGISEQRFIRSNACIQPADIVEEAEVVEDLEDQRWNGHGKSGEIDIADPFRVGWGEERLGTTEERFDFHPGDDVVGEIGAVEKGCCGAKVVAIAIELHEAERSMRHGE